MCYILDARRHLTVLTNQMTWNLFICRIERQDQLTRTSSPDDVFFKIDMQGFIILN